ncbi:MAG: ABC transporter permease, partial [Alphaproteobacteria bacterium]
DHDKTQSSRKLIETFGSSDYFRPYMIESPTVGMNAVATEQAKMLLVIPPDFEKELSAGRKGTVQIILDGADNSSISAIMNYLGTINVTAIYKIRDIPVTPTSLIDFKSRNLFNPELNSRWFAVPGITAVIVALVAIMLTALTVCKEWEQGSMEMLLSTPVTSLEIITGKLLPYALLSFIGFGIVFLAARIIFGVPFEGSYIILISATLLFILAYLAMGLYISVISHEQQVAVQFAAFIGLLPTALLSGFIFPVEYMPEIYQWVSMIFPARFYVEITRDQFLKAGSAADLWIPFLALSIQTLLLISASVLGFKRSLE